MKTYLFFIVTIVSCCFSFFTPGNVGAQVLTINDGVTLTIKSGSTLDVNCKTILVKTGGTLDLQSGGVLQDKGTLTKEAGGTFINSGTINPCTPNNIPVVTSGQSFSVPENSANSTVVGTVAATDDDADTTFSNWTITGGNVDNIFSINSNSGQITVTNNSNLNYENKTSYTLSVTVSDGIDTSNAENVIINVSNVNEAPVLGGIGNRTVDELVQLTFTATETDPDVADSHTFTLIDAPDGASIDPNSGVFTWTPTEAQGAETYHLDVVVTDNGSPNKSDSENISVTVNEVNVAPTLVNPGTQVNGELDVINFSINTTDTDLPVNTLTWSATGLPLNLSINTGNGIITGTINAGAASGSPYSVNVVVQDNGSPPKNNNISFDWTVSNTNHAPVLGTVGNKTVDELAQLSFTATETDIDGADSHTFSLTGEPAGASIDPNSGVFVWTPIEAQGPETFNFDVVVSDNGTPNMKDFETISVTVNEVNVAPVLVSPGNQTVEELSLLTFTASVTDIDLPDNTLTYSLTGKPTGAFFNTETGAFSWTPTDIEEGIYNVTLGVDDGTVEVTQSFTITVTNYNYPPAFTGTPAINGTAKIGFTLDLNDTGTFDKEGDTVTLNYQWAATGVDIAGAESASFTVGEAQKGKTVTCIITADDGKGGVTTYTTAGVRVYRFPWFLFLIQHTMD